MKKYHKILLSTFLLLCFSSILISCNSNDNSIQANSTPEENKTSEIIVSAAGDVLIHTPQIQAAFNIQNKSYNFDEYFTYVKDYISSADIAICNSETSYLGEGTDYTGYPTFNSPTELLDSLKNTGFDVLASAHNHILDKGSKGFINTAKAITDKGFDLIGIKNSSKDKNYIVKDVKGIKLGITNFSYSTLDSNGTRALNGIPLPKDLENSINTFASNNLKADLAKMKDTILNMKKDGAECIIFYMHWGNEYQTSPSKEQEDIAKELNSYGVDVILGSHPHVVQPIRTIINESSKKETLVFYSLGNFISNQRREHLGQSKSENGVLVNFKVYKDKDGVISIKEHSAIPTWVYKYSDKLGKVHYNIMPVKDMLEDDDSTLTAPVFKNMEDSLKSTESIINS